MAEAPDDDSNLGLSGWYDPRRLVGALPRRLRRWAPALTASGLMLGIAAGLVSMTSTYRLEATLRLVAPAQAMHLDAAVDPYDVPKFHPEEVQSWFHRTNIYEKVQALLTRPESVDQLRRMFTVTFDREASLFQVELSGARDAQDAEKLLSCFCNVVIDESKQQVRARIRADEQYYRQKVHDAVDNLNLAKSQLTEFSNANAFVGAETEATVRNELAARARSALADIEERLASLRARKDAIPQLMATIPAEIPQGRTLRNPTQQRREELEAEERRLNAIYTDNNPQLIAVRAEIASLKQRPAEVESQPDSMARNPVVSMLDTELAQISLNEPQLEREATDARARLERAEKALATLPQLSEQYRRLAGEVANHEALVRRLESRVAEIDIVAGLQGGQLQISDPPKSAYAVERGKAFKVFALGMVGAFVGFGTGCMFAAGSAVRDPFLRNAIDVRLVLRARTVERLPAPPSTIRDHRLWLQRMSEFVTGTAKSALVVPSDQQRDSALIARALAEQVARAGLKTLLVADTGLLGVPQGKGLSHVLDRELHPEQALTELEQRLSLLGIGDLPRLLDQVSSGNVERLMSELGGHFDFLLVAPPVAEIALLRRLTQALASLIVIVGPTGMPRAQAEEVERLRRPVALALMAD